MKGRAMAQTVMRLSLDANVRVRPQVSPCRIGVNAIDFYWVILSPSVAIITLMHNIHSSITSGIKWQQLPAILNGTKIVWWCSLGKWQSVLGIQVKRMHCAGK